ncbi:MUTS-like protein [Artemisia annua]|uniref:MUTS-like protein n=1 Tax=Artemisia annua TaxID=35608 RepID=A0A2U1LUC0_ARTAN|nr:MUTS-like protein [Artemisia annua]
MLKESYNQLVMDYTSINSVRLHKKRCVKGSVPYDVGNVLDANVRVVENVSGAESFKMSPVDRIFVRMGAKDHIMAGQSVASPKKLQSTEPSLEASSMPVHYRYVILRMGNQRSDG